MHRPLRIGKTSSLKLTTALAASAEFGCPAVTTLSTVARPKRSSLFIARPLQARLCATLTNCFLRMVSNRILVEPQLIHRDNPLKGEAKAHQYTADDDGPGEGGINLSRGQREPEHRNLGFRQVRRRCRQR